MPLIVDNSYHHAVSHRDAPPDGDRPAPLHRGTPLRTHRRRDARGRDRTRGRSPIADLLHRADDATLPTIAVMLIILAVHLITTAWTYAAYRWTCTPHTTAYYCDSWRAWTAHYQDDRPGTRWLWAPRDTTEAHYYRTGD